MKLKQGHCVAASQINEENLPKVLAAFRESGCVVISGFSIDNIRPFRYLEWFEERMVKTDVPENLEMILAVDQILSADEPATNWHERGELPPVNAMVEIFGDDLVYGQGESGEVIAFVEKTAVVRMSYGLGCFNAKNLRPLKSERERAIEEMLPILASLDGTQAKAEIACGELYDLGFRKEGK